VRFLGQFKAVPIMNTISQATDHRDQAMSQSYVNTVREFYGAFAQGDFASITLDPQIEWIEPNVPGLWFSGTHYGSEAVFKEVIEPASKNLDAFHVQCDHFLAADDHVIVTGHFQGRGRDTGIELNAPFAHVWTLHGDKAVRFQDYTDTANWLHALHRLYAEHPARV
jgi:ketosteroid isomerase-like protein